MGSALPYLFLDLDTLGGVYFCKNVEKTCFLRILQNDGLRLSPYNRPTKEMLVAFLDWYIRSCRTCGTKILLGETEHGRWVAYDVPVDNSSSWFRHTH